MNFNILNLISLVAIVFVNGVIPVAGDCVQDYNQGSTLQCGPGHPPCVALKDEGKFINEPNVPLACDDAKQVCQYPEYSALTVQCNQGPIEISWAGANSAFNSTANNAISYFISNQCTQPSNTTSSQDGDTLLIDCNPLKGDGTPCAPDYNFARQLSDPAAFQCGPGAKDCVALVGQEGTIIQSPNKADACDPNDRFCAFPEYSQLTVQCNQGTVTAQFAGTQNTFQNHAQNSFAYWMSNKCTGPSHELSTQDGDLLVVDCNPLANKGPE